MKPSKIPQNLPNRKRFERICLCCVGDTEFENAFFSPENFYFIKGRTSASPIPVSLSLFPLYPQSLVSCQVTGFAMMENALLIQMKSERATEFITKLKV